MSSEPHSQTFAPTRWTLVLRARGDSPQARAALSELCEAYYQPVLRFLRREGRDNETTHELTQEFFARILGKGGFDRADPDRGKFRSYLLGALKHFLADQRKAERRLKRGGGIAAESLDSTSSEDEQSSGFEIADSSWPAPDAFFDREWALTIMGRALRALETEWVSNGKTNHFQVLKPWLMGDAPSLSQAEAARQLNLSEGAVKVAVHRLRKRFRDVLRSEIAQTLRDPASIDEELRHLVAALEPA